MDRKKIDRDLRSLSELEAMLAVKRQISDDPDAPMPEVLANTVKALEDVAVEIALPLEQPPAFALELIKDRGLEDFAAHDFSPAEAPTNGPYLAAILEREAKRRKRKK